MIQKKTRFHFSFRFKFGETIFSNMKNSNWVFFLLPLLMLGSCQNDDDDDDKNTAPTLTSTQKISRTWIMTEGTVERYVDNNLTNTENLITSLDPCDADDETTFNSTGTFQQMEGETKCNPNSPDLIDFGTWSFSDDENILYLNYNDDDYGDTIDIVSLTSSEMKIMLTEIDSNESYISRITFTEK